MAFQQPQEPQEKVTLEWDGMAGDWDDMAGGYAEAFHHQLWKLTNLDRPVDCVVDFGCGTGLLTERLLKDCNQIIAIDAAPKMVEIVLDKIKSREWTNVSAMTAVLGKEDPLPEVKESVDLIVASSVLSFIPSSTLEATMKVLGKYLRRGGLFCHSDFPDSDSKPPGVEGMTKKKMETIYAMAGLVVDSIHTVRFNLGDNHDFDVVIGVARKP